MARTTVGRDWMIERLHGDAPYDNEAQIIALSEVATAISQSWEEFGGAPGNELAADGFARQVADYAHVAGTSTTTLNHVFTHSGPSGGGTPRTINKVAVFAYANGGANPGAADSGIMVYVMDEPNPPTLTGTDSLDQTVLVDFGA